MAIKTKIKKDALGLYTVCGGYISRPFFGTQFEEGDTVNTHHFGGTINAGVTLPDRKETHNFKKGGIFEYWGTTGISNTHYKLKRFNKDYENLFGSKYDNFDDYLRLDAEWHRKQYPERDRNFLDFNKGFIREGLLKKLLDS
jgi:hypothetical protein